jgi:hypothetical protein
MATKLDPFIYEHDTAEEAEAFDRALRERVAKAQASTKPGIPHEQVMREARELIEAQARKQRH